MAIENFIQGNVIKHEAVIDLDKLARFRAKHDVHIAERSRDPAGQDYAVLYIPSAIALSAQIRCRCGAQEDITDYSNI